MSKFLKDLAAGFVNQIQAQPHRAPARPAQPQAKPVSPNPSVQQAYVNPSSKSSAYEEWERMELMQWNDLVSRIDDPLTARLILEMLDSNPSVRSRRMVIYIRAKKTVARDANKFIKAHEEREHLEARKAFHAEVDADKASRTSAWARAIQLAGWIWTCFAVLAVFSLEMAIHISKSVYKFIQTQRSKRSQKNATAAASAASSAKATSDSMSQADNVRVLQPKKFKSDLQGDLGFKGEQDTLPPWGVFTGTGH